MECGTGFQTVQGDGDQLTGNRLDDAVALIVGTVLQHLLTEVVAEGVGHEFCKVLKRLGEDHISVSRYTLLELLLQVSTAVLIFAEREDVSLHVFEASVDVEFTLSTGKLITSWIAHDGVRVEAKGRVHATAVAKGLEVGRVRSSIESSVTIISSTS